jgi:hypothetical protein
MENYPSKFIVVTALISSISVSIIKNLAPSNIIGGWDIVSYLLLLLPLFMMIFTKNVENRYTRWFILPVIILIFDIFYYNNYLSQNLLPFVVYVAIFILYSGSLQSIKQPFQIVIPKLGGKFNPFGIVEHLFSPLKLNSIRDNLAENSLYSRIMIAMIITIPVFGLLLALFISSNPEFGQFIKRVFNFRNPFEFHHIFTIPMLFFVIISMFDFAFSNRKRRELNLNKKPFDPLIIGIFLGALNFLFITFLFFQISYLFGGESYIAQKSGLSIASYARKGFFELTFVLVIVFTIFLVVIYRFKGERFISILMSSLMFQSVVVGFSSLQKIYLYQKFMGATVLRYYVEWFDYFIMLTLLVGGLFLFLKRPFYQILNLIIVFATLSFIFVASLNVEGMVASYNLKKFSSTPEKLDRDMLSSLSVDALPYLKGSGIKPKRKIRDCSKFYQFHLGYCLKSKLLK